MSGAHEQAISAHDAAIEAAEAERRAATEKAIAEAKRRSEHAKQVAEAGIAKLVEWMPGTEWRYFESGYFGRDVILMERGAEHTDPLKIKVECYNINPDADKPVWRTRLYIGNYVQDTSIPGYTYFSGDEVKSAADIGRYLAAKGVVA